MPLTADSLDPAGIYFGTRNGELYGSIDEGKTWKKLLGGLPPVVCVKSVLVASLTPPQGPRTKAPPSANRCQIFRSESARRAGKSRGKSR